MIDNLYYGGKPCACCAGSPRNDLSEAIFSADILEGFLRKIYDGFDVSREIEPSAWREVLRILNEGAVKGLTQGGERQHTPQFLQAIKHSNEVFSAFKCHSMGVKMAERLHDKDGNLRPFKEWREAVQPIASHHVGAWLKTEYDTAVLRAHQGSLWQEFERNKDILPNLRWMPTTSVSPENVHKGYWTSRLTLPVDDPFWQDNHPANRWNCKCSLEATSDKADTGHVAEMARQDNTSQQGLENNPRDGHLFSDKHPYFPDSCSSCPFKKQSKLKNWIGRLFNKGGQTKDCSDCPYVDLEVAKAKFPENYKEYLKYKEDKDYFDVEFDPINGGVKAIHKGHKLNDTHQKRFFGKNISSKDLELSCLEQLFRMGNKAILLDEKKKGDNGLELTALDLSLNGKKMDIRSITEASNKYVNALTDKDKQIKNWNKISDPEDFADSLCLYFYDPSMYSKQSIENAIQSYKNIRGSKGKICRIKSLYVVVKDKPEVLEFNI